MPAVAAPGKKVDATPKTATAQATVTDAEVRDAVNRHFFFDGQMIVKHLYTLDGIGRYRVNWFRDSDEGPYIHETRFLFVGKVKDAVDVQDVTVR